MTIRTAAVRATAGLALAGQALMLSGAATAEEAGGSCDAQTVEPYDARRPGQTTEEAFHGIPGYIYDLYGALLDREPDRDGFRHWVEANASGATDLRDTAFRFSQAVYGERGAAGVRPDTFFLDEVYLHLFDRPADPEGKAYWQGQLSRLGRDGVVLAMSATPEARGAEDLQDFGTYVENLARGIICRPS